MVKIYLIRILIALPFLHFAFWTNYKAEKKSIVSLPSYKMESYLPSAFFTRTHRNYSVNTQCIQSIDTVDNLIDFKCVQSVILSETSKDFISQFQVLR